MTGKWIARLLESAGSPELPGNETLITLKTAKTEVSRVLRVPVPSVSGTTCRPPCIDPAIVQSYHAARQQLAADVPDGVSTLHWDQVLTDADAFLVTWGDTAARLGWTITDLFEMPGHWIGGLIWSIAGGLVLELSEQVATIEAEGRMSFYARPLPSTTAARTEADAPHCPPWRRGIQHQKH